MRVDIPVGLQLLFGTNLQSAVEEDGTGGLVIEVFDDLDKVCADVVLPSPDGDQTTYYSYNKLGNLQQGNRN